MRNSIAKLVLLIGLLLPFTAFSQVWLPERDTREGPGVKLGDSLVFHPGVGIEGGYDLNPLRRNTNIEGAGRLRVTPYLDLATRSKKRKVVDEGVEEVAPPKVDFRLGLAGYYDMYFSGDKAIDEQDNFGIDTHLSFVLFPQGRFSLLTSATYIRSLQPYESGEEHWSWHNVNPSVGFRIRPGGGTLSIEAGYKLSLMIFEDNFLSKPNNKMTHEARLITSWKIMPKTALVAKVTFSPIIYFEQDKSEEYYNNNSMPVRGMVGVQGLLTPRFGLSLYLGYGGSFYEAGDDFDSVIAQGELMFFITPTANIRLGGARDFVDSYYANFYSKNGGYLKYEQMFGGIFLASLKGDCYYRIYSSFDENVLIRDANPSSSDRKDLWISATLLLEVRALDWLSFHASAVFATNITDFEWTDSNLNLDFPVQFNQFQVFAGVRIHY